MTNKQRQFYSSVLAVVFCGLFLLTGRLFIWKTPAAEIERDHPAESSAAAPEVTVPTGTGITVTTTAQTEASAKDSQSPSESTTVPTDSAATDAQQTTVSTETPPQTQPTETQKSGTVTDAPEGYFSDVLFIGDSRTVGMANYAPIEGADYFATVGLATYKVAEAENEVGEKKDLSFAQLLSSRTYGKVYIMLGINELGNEREKTLTHYQELIDQIHTAQPNAIICIEANLHVAQTRAEQDDVINNEQINSLNAALSQFADNVSVYYLDVNPLFDDETGALGAEYTHDGTHPLAKYYLTWAEWLKSHAIVK